MAALSNYQARFGNFTSCASRHFAPESKFSTVSSRGHAAGKEFFERMTSIRAGLRFLLECATERLLKLVLRRHAVPRATHTAATATKSPPDPGAAGKSVVVLAPHIDDETISCGGTLRRHVLAGDSVAVIFMTDGSRSANAPEDIVARREAEADRAVRQILGIERLVFLRYRDKELARASGAGERLEKILRELNPDVLYVPSPWDPHPDHVATADLASQAWQRDGTLIRLYESFCPHTPRLLNRFVNITDQYATKAAAMKEFNSQVVSFDSILLLNRIQSAAIGHRGVKSVEAFIEVMTERFPVVCKMLATTPVRPRRISHLRNVARSYLTNLWHTRALARQLASWLPPRDGVANQ